MKLRLFVWMELFVHFVVFISVNFFPFHFILNVNVKRYVYCTKYGWIEKRSNWKSVDNKPKTKRNKAKRELLKYKAEMRKKRIREILFMWSEESAYVLIGSLMKWQKEQNITTMKLDMRIHSI